MKKVLLSTLGCLLVVTVYSQNRYTQLSTTQFTPRSYDELMYEAQLNQIAIQRNNETENNKLNKDIKHLLRICDDELLDPEWCYGEYRDVVYSIKKQLENVNYQSETTGISLVATRNILNQSVRKFNNALKKHIKDIERENKKNEKQNKDLKNEKLKGFLANISVMNKEISNILKNKKKYNSNFISIMSGLSKELKLLKKYDLSDEFVYFTALDEYKSIVEKYNNAFHQNIYK